MAKISINLICLATADIQSVNSNLFAECATTSDRSVKFNFSYAFSYNHCVVYNLILCMLTDLPTFYENPVVLFFIAFLF